MAAMCDAPTKVFQVYCVTGCHTPGVFPPDLSGSNPETRLIGKAGAECGNFLDSSKPANGSLLKKIMGTSCADTRMPLGGTALSDENIKCVVDWANSKL